MADINPRSLAWTNCEAPQPAQTIRDNLYLDDGITPSHEVQFPTKAHPWPRNALDLDEPMKGPAETAKLSRNERITLLAMTAAALVLVVSAMVFRL